MKCNICGGDTIPITAYEKMFATGEKFSYRRCVDCKHTVIEIVPDDMSKYYPPEYYSLKKRTILDYVLSLKKSASFKAVESFNIPKTAHILDYGAGRGDLVYEMHMRGYKRTWGYDPYIDKVSVLTATRWNLIMLHHVIEHVPDPLETLIDLKQRLLPNGHILLRLPVIDSYAYDRYGANWVGFDAPRHITLFSRQSIRELTRSIGLETLFMYDDSSHFQFTVSELYEAGKPLSDHNLRSRVKGYRKHHKKADELNRVDNGDQIVMLLKAK